jgi:hypothetical protein
MWFFIKVNKKLAFYSTHLGISFFLSLSKYVEFKPTKKTVKCAKGIIILTNISMNALLKQTSSYHTHMKHHSHHQNSIPLIIIHRRNVMFKHRGMINKAKRHLYCTWSFKSCNTIGLKIICILLLVQSKLVWAGSAFQVY